MTHERWLRLGLVVLISLAAGAGSFFSTLLTAIATAKGHDLPSVAWLGAWATGGLTFASTLGAWLLKSPLLKE